MVEEKDIDIQYIQIEDKLAEITKKNTSEAYFSRHMKRITEGELWELMNTERENVKRNGVTDNAITHDKTDYSSHALTKFVDGKNRNEWVLITRSRTGK